MSSKTNYRKQTITYRWLRMTLYTAIAVLMAFVFITPVVLRLMYRADAGVALGNAKSVRLALQVTATEQYGKNEVFRDISKTGGVSKELYEEVLCLSKAPGEFWVLQTDESGYKVQRFVYIEGAYTVWYQADSASKYTVYHENRMIHTGE